jgi:hypothetical protein
MRFSRTSGVLAAFGLALVAAAPARAQETLTANRARITGRAVIGGTTIPTAGVLRLIGATARTAGQSVLSIDGSGDVTAGALARADLAAAVAYEDEANVFAGATTIRGAVSGTASGVDEIRLGTIGGVPRLYLEDATFAPWAIDNAAGTFRLLTGSAIGFALTAGGTMTLQPTTNLILGPATNSTLPNLGYQQNLGSLTNKFLTVHAAELWIETLVAQNTIATIGGRILVGPTTVLTRDLLASNVTGTYPTQTVLTNGLCVKHNAFQLHVPGVELGSKLVMESSGKFETFTVIDTTVPVAGFGEYCYIVYRNQDNSGVNDWYAGDAVFDTGKTGSGFVDVYSVRGLSNASQIGPTIVGNVRTSITYNGWAPRWAIGNLNGVYGYAVDTYGAAFGDAAAANVAIDATNGIRFRSGTSDLLTLTGSTLDLKNAGVIKSGAATTLTAGSGIWLAAGSGTPTFRIGDPATNYVKWDATNLTLKSASVLIDAGGITLTPTASPGYTALASYKFAIGAAGGTQSGLAAYEASGIRELYLNNIAGTSALGNFYVQVGTGGAATAQLAVVSGNGGATLPGVGITGTQFQIGGGGGSTFTINMLGAVPAGVGMRTAATGYLVINSAGSQPLYLNLDSGLPVYAAMAATGVAYFPVVSNSGTLLQKNDGLNGVASCPGGIKTITFEFGIATNFSC